jgi:cell division protein FtsN
MLQQKNSYWLLWFLGLGACSPTKQDNLRYYRLVGKDGKVIYVDQRRPKLNEEYLTKQQTRQSQKETKEKTITPVISSENSHAYGTSVLDGVLPQQTPSFQTSIQNLSSGENNLTIKDFDYLPAAYLADERTEEMKQKKEKTGKNIQEEKNRGSPAAPISKVKSTKTTPEEAKIIDASGTKRLAEFEGNTSYHLQLGMFASKNRAEALVQKFQHLIPQLQVEERQKSNGTVLYRVVAGGFIQKKDVDDTIDRLKKEGHREVYVFRR